MGHIDHLTFVFVFLFVGIFLLCSAPATFSMSAKDVEREVIRLFDQSESIPQVRITPAEKDRFVVELIFNIGDRWGRNGFVRDLAKTALTRVFNSKLPLAQGIVKVYCKHMEVIHLAVGMNQAKQMSWEDSSSPSEFFDRLRSCVRWGKRAEDRTYFIENRQIIKPSPVVSFPPDS
ncbi:MAG: hypothetical protein A2V86_12065 [Deltaproteobacteria bacterium RBG_16_49_23]|nr:MAG: hypothetical protein A2V86_12065 [Deltaproteobacteria bacterium RBG_16_49_23]